MEKLYITYLQEGLIQKIQDALPPLETVKQLVDRKDYKGIIRLLKKMPNINSDHIMMLMSRYADNFKKNYSFYKTRMTSYENVNKMVAAAFATIHDKHPNKKELVKAYAKVVKLLDVSEIEKRWTDRVPMLIGAFLGLMISGIFLTGAIATLEDVAALLAFMAVVTAAMFIIEETTRTVAKGLT